MIYVEVLYVFGLVRGFGGVGCGAAGGGGAAAWGVGARSQGAPSE